MRLSLKTVHRLSAYLLITFIAFHFFNHLLALLGPDAHTATMRLFRNVYRIPFVEIGLMLSVLTQTISGIVLIIKQPHFWKSKVSALQVASGLYLAFFLINHVRAVLMARYSWHIETDFYFAANVAVDPNTKSFFLPYYSFAVLSVFLHLACAHYRRRLMLSGDLFTENRQFQVRVKREAMLIGVSGIVVAALIMASFGGFLYKF
ncbi:hypothetical protein [Dyadobacter pollutisoli]|jgi:succinate dehydrogenase/fumarate reductase cytochrome b subunit|uniref:Succinate dehydrogenase n=1 Tax=Dyadobacter pollutisoli TaxID=2910158 RepID=A0A9E8NGE9_9BACT|nr:hypothetical protein [Dyadobacter pollutisoli]WAC14833.1 hypothetical protein ON006_12890 [Dyadobacter pollutisoli]